MLDEIDKIGASYHGDPASALLEVLDPEQNAGFLDHYLDVRVDLSRVLFICTANQLDTIPPALLDRMETIRLAGYLTGEKRVIARKHLWPKRLSRAGVPRGRVQISDAGLRLMVEGYARESGVRGLDQQLDRVVRHAIVELMEGKPALRRVSAKNIETYLGAPLYQEPRHRHEIGVVTGLAWTALGGTVLSVEAAVVHAHSRGLKLTGHLGAVMTESADIAYSYIVAHLAELGALADCFEQAHLHIHVPEGATPKDGPSAGVTIASALLSLARKRAPRRQLAMTGELTLTGQVLPVGAFARKCSPPAATESTKSLFPAPMLVTSKSCPKI
ncbi:MAG: ATP-dependent Lon protease [Gammaproteobacteria bacterium]|jgi:ATP-dependent Lon protease